MITTIHPDNPNTREVDRVVALLQRDGVIICPTDTVYAFMCSLNSKKAYERLLKIKGVREKDANFSLIFLNLSHLSDYVKVNNLAFRTLKSNLPGAFTFILNPSGKVPDKVLGRRKSIGVRIPDSNILMAVLEKLEYPLLTTSIRADDSIVEYETDPEVLHGRYEKLVDIVINGGYGGNVPSTIVDCTVSPYELVREGKGVLI